MKRPVVIALLALCGLSCGCRDRFDVPDTPADVPAANITIASLHAFLHAETVVVREELTVGGTVVSSDEAGNFYRTLVLDDHRIVFDGAPADAVAFYNDLVRARFEAAKAQR